MGLGGVILAGVGIVVVVLVANNRWSATWNAMLGNDARGNPLQTQRTDHYGTSLGGSPTPQGYVLA